MNANRELTLFAILVQSLVLFCLGLPVYSQIEFVEVTTDRGVVPNVVDLGFGGGVAAFDFDEDGDIDLFLPQRLDSPDRLYVNDGLGNFSDVASESGLPIALAGRSAMWLDYDDDHLVDLLIASDCFNSVDPACNTQTSIRLYRQISEGLFQDVTIEAGLSNAGTEQFFGHRAGICSGDIDLDGDLDLAIGQWEGELQLFINNNGVFVDESAERGIVNPNSPQPFNTWQSVMCDFNNDGWLDIFTAVDFFENQLWMNQGDGSFINVAQSAGANFAFNDMGVTVGDYDSDGDFDIFVTNIFEDGKHNLLLRNQSTIDSISFDEVSFQAGVDNTDFGWGATFFDANNDTVLDLAVTNGWFNGVGFEDRSKMFIGSTETPGTFIDVTEESGFNDTFFGSCLISADLNRDGDLDLLQVCNPALFEGPFRVLENQLNETSSSNWISIEPRQAGMNHWSIGSVVTVEIGEKTLIRLIGAGTSIHGQEPAEAFFGLGEATHIDRIIVRWPHGDESVWENVDANQQFLANDADLNLDGEVGLLDIFSFQQSFGKCNGPCQADFDNNGVVDLGDAQLFVDQILRALTP